MTKFLGILLLKNSSRGGGAVHKSERSPGVLGILLLQTIKFQEPGRAFRYYPMPKSDREFQEFLGCV
jgi:hypothetical protein